MWGFSILKDLWQDHSKPDTVIEERKKLSPLKLHTHLMQEIVWRNQKKYKIIIIKGQESRKVENYKDFKRKIIMLSFSNVIVVPMIIVLLGTVNEKFFHLDET